MPSSRLAPGVTVVVPVWDDYARFLDATLSSIAGQCENLEILLVDNASSEPIVVPGCRVVSSQQRLTRGAARNLGLEAVGTEFVMFWDADDQLADGALTAMIDAMAPDVRLVGCLVAEQHSGELHRWPSMGTFRLCQRSRLFALAELVWPRFPVTGSLLRTVEARELGGYSDSDLAEHWPLAARLAARGRIVLLERPGIRYRIHPAEQGGDGGAAVVAQGRLARRSVRSDPSAVRIVSRLTPLAGLASYLVAYVVRPLLGWWRARA